MQKAIENNTESPMYVGGIMIPPGETRVIENADLPPEHKDVTPLPPDELPADPLADLAAGTVKTIVAGLSALTAEELVRLQAIEEAGQKRKTVQAAIAAEQLRRADEQLSAENTQTGDPSIGDTAAKVQMGDTAAGDTTSAAPESAGA